MSVLIATPYVMYYVETDDPEFNEYRRGFSGEWECRIGESWEACYDSTEVEAAFQEYLRSKS